MARDQRGEAAVDCARRKFVSEIARSLTAAFLGFLSGTVAVGAPSTKMPTIGWLALGAPINGPDLRNAPFFEGLSKLGWTEGKNFAVERRFADGNADRLRELAVELVRLKVDVIVAGDSAAIPAAQSATSTIPIVMTVSSDPVGQGFVASLARPGGNVTGLSNISPELAAKRVQLLREIVPAMSRVAVFGPADLPDWAELQTSTRGAGLHLVPLKVTDPREFENAFDAAVQNRVDAVIVLPSPFTNPYAKRISQLATGRHLPAIYGPSFCVPAGGLIAYGPNIPDLYRRAATYVDKILKGAKPADLPIEQPTKYELAINLKTAKALGITVPQSLLQRADEVIE